MLTPEKAKELIAIMQEEIAIEQSNLMQQKADLAKDSRNKELKAIVSTLEMTIARYC